ncbi:HBR337Cp [Eremothecium sinecaudum]|uniref:RING-type E3 ubiquitin transferase n=1 Tax=Eremothecium sinecaudum TaxID=45286 RepID=A0A109UXF2_9SACH|nr:HBR337Cp [Eremothecium sinecaudum]AMD19238.1 HBR337Cp [Eremothecium sinecaudum]
MQQDHPVSETERLVRWQEDNLVRNCSGCSRRFTFILRRHHCRCCGSIFCSSCAGHFAYYDKDRVKILQRSERSMEIAPYRTCNTCFKTLENRGLLVSRGRLVSNTRLMKRSPQEPGFCDSASFTSYFKNTMDMDAIVSCDAAVNADDACHSESQNAPWSNNKTSNVPEEYNMCPICSVDLSSLSEEGSATHIQDCVQQASCIQQHQKNYVPDNNAVKNRILVYLIADDSRNSDGEFPECPICFEDMELGQKIGRLECLCMFHHHCIKSWLKKKLQRSAAGGSSIQSTKNFCPFHDAIF